MRLLEKFKNLFKKNKEVIEQQEEKQIKEPVYVNAGANASKKYHATPDAHNMDGAVLMDREEADAKGYVPCSKCFKK